MSLVALGLSHQTAPVAIRERMAFAPETLDAALLAAQALEGVQECAIISTCNRTELYFSAAEPNTSAWIDWLHAWHQLPPGQFREYIYTLRDHAAIMHLFKVTSGMDSMVLGEPQVVGQVKQAWHSAQQCNTIGSVLDRLFQHAFQTSKQIRSQTGIGHNPVTLPFAALKLTHQIFGQIAPLKALMIGAGEMIEDVTRHFASHELTQQTIANRSLQRAQDLIERSSAPVSAMQAIALAEIDHRLHEHDVVVACTGSTQAVLTAEMLKTALKKRRNRPMFVLDLAVPRNVEPDAAKLQDVYLYTVDDLREIAERGHQQRSEALVEANRIVDIQTELFQRWINLHATSQTLKALRQRAFVERDRLLEQALREINSGRDADEVLRRLSHRLTNRLLHAPSVQLRQAGEAMDEDLLRAARQLLLDELP
ncbi:MAG: glutamyl-tRNA reductase [Pseudomonadota bacterium]